MPQNILQGSLAGSFTLEWFSNTNPLAVNAYAFDLGPLSVFFDGLSGVSGTVYLNAGSTGTIDLGVPPIYNSWAH